MLFSSTNESFDKQLPSIKFCLVEITTNSPSKQDKRQFPSLPAMVSVYVFEGTREQRCVLVGVLLRTYALTRCERMLLESFIAALLSGVKEVNCFELHPLTVR